ncbi:hypothetical protein K438DRAFT_2095735 [Mycena galopus ATCC 62051]|nr:hypothetical protein K438DRAFT_2095735 [Mycena galopus ATCC 62051]
MFNDGIGHHIHGGIFYNVGGDVNLQNLQTHHNLTIQDRLLNRHTGFQPPPGSTSELEDAWDKASTPRRALTDRDLHVGAGGSNRDWQGAARSERQRVAARPRPYDLRSRKRPSGKSLHDVPSDERSQPSPPSSTSIVSSDGLPRPFPPATPFNHHLPFTSSSLVPYMDIAQKNLPGSIHGGTFFTAANVNFFGTKKRRREKMSDGSVRCADEASPTQTTEKRRRLGEEDGVKIIPKEYLKLIHEIGWGPGYLLHAGRNNSRAVIVKVFHKGPNVRQQLESTVALSKEFMHPNVLRIEGISAFASMSHFIVYESGISFKLHVNTAQMQMFILGHCMNAEGPLAAALKDDLARSVTLGFKMVWNIQVFLVPPPLISMKFQIAGLSDFDIFLDVDDRFLISINPPQRRQVEATQSRESEDNTWTVFNALCQKTLTSANGVVHQEHIIRDTAILGLSPNSASEALPLLSLGSTVLSQHTQVEEREELPVQPRREYIWRTLDRGQQSLATVARRITQGLDTNFSRVHRLTRTNRRFPHRCQGAVVVHDTPSPLEICSVCHEVVGLDERFQCICGDTTPGSNHTIKCRECKLWSHSDCVGNPNKEFTCHLCVLPTTVIDTLATNYSSINPPPLPAAADLFSAEETTDLLEFLHHPNNVGDGGNDQQSSYPLPRTLHPPPPSTPWVKSLSPPPPVGILPPRMRPFRRRSFIPSREEEG